jgi:hypothetical protein
MGEYKMFTLSKKLCAATLGLALLFAATNTANAQSFGGRTSTREKAAYIGGGAAAGALIGGLLGGTKGAVIGGLLGAGGGTGYVYYKGKQDEDRYGRYYGYSDNRDYRGYSERRNDYYRDDRGRNSWDRDRRYSNGFRR